MNRYTHEQTPVRTTTRGLDRKAKFSAPSLIAIAAAIISLFLSAGWGLLFAVVAIVLGVVGFFLALSPRVRGGVVSVVSMLAGGLGILIALLRFVF